MAVLIFGLGGGISFYEGVQHIRPPQPLHDPTWNYAVLGAAAVFEGISFAIALRQFRRLAGGTPFWEFAHRGKDPTTYTVLAEDSAALVGLAIAAVGIALSHLLQMPALDGAASVLIGILLASVAVLLAWQSRGLLIGEGTFVLAHPTCNRSKSGTLAGGPHLERWLERIGQNTKAIDEEVNERYELHRGLRGFSSQFQNEL